MRALFLIGIIVLILGIASLFVAIPHTHREGISAGDMSVGVNVHNEEKVSPIISGILIVGGIGLMVAGARK